MAHRPLLAQLLAYVAASASDERFHAGVGPDVAQGEEREFDWLLAAGLGPLLYRATRNTIEEIPQPRRDRLLAADLTARVVHGARVGTAKEILDVAAREGIAITLLKGISISAQCYPEEHLRPMADIDVLVTPEDCALLESSLVRLGYARLASHVDHEGQHHGAPLHDPSRHVWVEVHTALFARANRLHAGTTFNAFRVDQRSRPSTFHGRGVRRLSDELQLAYIASSWMDDLSRRRVHPSFAIPLFDAVHLLAASKSNFDWRELLRDLDNEMAIASLYVMLSYLTRHRVTSVDRAILSHLARRQRLVGLPQRFMMHLMLDRYLLGGRYWNLRFPPPAPERYMVRHQWEKRVVRKLRSIPWRLRKPRPAPPVA